MALVAALALVATACRSSDGRGSETTQPSTSDTTSSTASTSPRNVNSEEAVRADYAAFWDLYIDFGGRTEPFERDQARSVLAAHATSRQLDTLLDSFEQLRRDGLVLRGRPENAPTVGVTFQSATQATVADCMADSGGVYKSATGERVDKPTSGRQLTIAHMVLEEGVWKVADLGGNQPCSV